MLSITYLDRENKEYFTETNPVFWFALGSIMFSLWSACIFTGIKDFQTAVFFLIFAVPAVWFSYWLIVMAFYKKAPLESPAKILWRMRKDAKHQERINQYNNGLGIILNPFFKMAGFLFKSSGYLILGISSIFLFIFLFGIFASLSLHAILFVIIVLLIVK